MKEVNKVFFGEVGLTSTSAQHICNMCNERIQTIKSDLNNIRFVNENLQVLGSNEVITIQKGRTSLDEIEGLLDQISKLNCLIAWLKEAIKAKDEELTYIKNLSIYDYISFDELNYPSPVKFVPFNEFDILSRWSIKERNEYYSLEAEASTIGKFIHKDSAFSNARKDLQNKIQNPTEVEHCNTGVLIHTFSPSVENVEEYFFKLQDKHRSVTAKLNSLKYKLKKELEEANLAKANEIEKLNSENQSIRDNVEMQFYKYKELEISRISSLKIVIPNDLRDIYEQINR